MDDRAGPHSNLARGIHVRVGAQPTPARTAAGPVDSVRHHQHFVPVLVLRPAIEKINYEKIRAAIGSWVTEWQPNSLGGCLVGCREVLHDLNRSISHVADSDCSCGWLSANKCAQVVEVQSQAWAGSIVNKNEKIESGAVISGRNPLCHRQAFLALLHDNIFGVNGWNTFVTRYIRCNRNPDRHGCGPFLSP